MGCGQSTANVLESPTSTTPPNNSAFKASAQSTPQSSPQQDTVGAAVPPASHPPEPPAVLHASPIIQNETSGLIIPDEVTERGGTSMQEKTDDVKVEQPTMASTALKQSPDFPLSGPSESKVDLYLPVSSSNLVDDQEGTERTSSKTAQSEVECNPFTEVSAVETTSSKDVLALTPERKIAQIDEAIEQVLDLPADTQQSGSVKDLNDGIPSRDLDSIEPKFGGQIDVDMEPQTVEMTSKASNNADSGVRTDDAVQLSNQVDEQKLTCSIGNDTDSGPGASSEVSNEGTIIANVELQAVEHRKETASKSTEEKDTNKEIPIESSSVEATTVEPEASAKVKQTPPDTITHSVPGSSTIPTVTVEKIEHVESLDTNAALPGEVMASGSLKQSDSQTEVVRVETDLVAKEFKVQAVASEVVSIPNAPEFLSHQDEPLYSSNSEPITQPALTENDEQSVNPILDPGAIAESSEKMSSGPDVSQTHVLNVEEIPSNAPLPIGDHHHFTVVPAELSSIAQNHEVETTSLSEELASVPKETQEQSVDIQKQGDESRAERTNAHAGPETSKTNHELPTDPVRAKVEHAANMDGVVLHQSKESEVSSAHANTTVANEPCQSEILPVVKGHAETDPSFVTSLDKADSVDSIPAQPPHSEQTSPPVMSERTGETFVHSDVEFREDAKLNQGAIVQVIEEMTLVESVTGQEHKDYGLQVTPNDVSGYPHEAAPADVDAEEKLLPTNEAIVNIPSKVSDQDHITVEVQNTSLSEELASVPKETQEQSVDIQEQGDESRAERTHAYAGPETSKTNHELPTDPVRAKVEHTANMDGAVLRQSKESEVSSAHANTTVANKPCQTEILPVVKGHAETDPSFVTSLDKADSIHSEQTSPPAMSERTGETFVHSDVEFQEDTKLNQGAIVQVIEEMTLVESVTGQEHKDYGLLVTPNDVSGDLLEAASADVGAEEKPLLTNDAIVIIPSKVSDQDNITVEVENANLSELTSVPQEIDHANQQQTIDVQEPGNDYIAERTGGQETSKANHELPTDPACIEVEHAANMDGVVLLQSKESELSTAHATQGTTAADVPCQAEIKPKVKGDAEADLSLISLVDKADPIDPLSAGMQQSELTSPPQESTLPHANDTHEASLEFKKQEDNEQNHVAVVDGGTSLQEATVEELRLTPEGGANDPRIQAPTPVVIADEAASAAKIDSFEIGDTIADPLDAAAGEDDDIVDESEFVEDDTNVEESVRPLEDSTRAEDDEPIFELKNVTAMTRVLIPDEKLSKNSWTWRSLPKSESDEKPSKPDVNPLQALSQTVASFESLWKPRTANPEASKVTSVSEGLNEGITKEKEEDSRIGEKAQAAASVGDEQAAEGDRSSVDGGVQPTDSKSSAKKRKLTDIERARMYAANVLLESEERTKKSTKDDEEKPSFASWFSAKK